MDFSLTTMFVVPPSNSLPTTGGPQDLTAKQLGVYRNDYTVATTGNIAAAPYIYVAQGRAVSVPGLGTKLSDKISKLKVTEWFKVVAEPDKLNQITEVSDFTVPCGTSVSVTLRLHSNYIDNAFFNGLTRTVTVLTPCCECGADPCVDIDPQATVDLIVAEINSEEFLSQFVTASRTGTGTDSVLKIVGKDLVTYTGANADPNAFPYQNDRLSFRVFVYEAPATSQDDVVPDRCETVATVTVIQRATYIHGSSEEIKILERRYFSYQAKNKHIYGNNNYNEYQTEVVSGTFYDLYYVKFKLYEDDTWYQGATLDAAVIIAVPTGEGGTLETLLETAFGAAVDKSGTDVTTTTTTSTSTTTTTSTTILQP
jgi:hypothetical protein